MCAWIVLLAGAAIFADQAPAPPEELKSEVRRLIRQLDAEQLAARDAAEQALVEKGPAIYDLLPPSGEGLSAEVQQRLARVRLKLQQALVASAAQPSLITLTAEKTPLGKVLKEIERQSGNKILLPGGQLNQSDAGPPLTFTLKKIPFWEALDRVCQDAGLRIYPFGDQPGVILFNRGPGGGGKRAFVSVDGPFRFAVAEVAAVRDFRYAKSVLRVNLETAWEPRLRPIVLTQKSQDVVAEDDRGQKIALLPQDAEQEIPAQGEACGVELSLPFANPPREAQRLVRLQGRIAALIPGRVETFRFENLLKAKNQQQRGAGVSVTLEEVLENNSVWEVRIRVRFDAPGDALASHRGWIFRNKAFLEDPEGKTIPYDSMETTLQTHEEVGLTYLFVLEKPPADLTFVYKTPGAILSRTFQYEFKDIPLP